VINAYLTSGTFPTTFKQARVTPLLKKPSLPPTQVENYRPVSFVPFLSKTIQRAVFKQVTEFFSQNNLLDPYQSGFKSGHSAEMVLLAVTEALKEARLTAKSSVLSLLNFSAAFDTVNHGMLLSILSSMGITGRAHSWFESYLTGRSFKVCWFGHTSAANHLATGVPPRFSTETSSLCHIHHLTGPDVLRGSDHPPESPSFLLQNKLLLLTVSGVLL